MTEPGQAPRFEPRWPVALAILGVIGLLTLLPGRVRLFPGYAPYVLAIVALAPIIAIELTKGSARWRRIERIVTALFVVAIAFGNLANLANLIVKVQEGATDISGLHSSPRASRSGSPMSLPSRCCTGISTARGPRPG